MTVPSQLAALHHRAFTTTRAWNAAEFESLLVNPHCFLCIESSDTGQTSLSAFALGRVIADEAEILTLATDPNQRRHGYARKCLYQFERIAKNRGAVTAFLEVAADNLAAVALYKSTGYQIHAKRAAYYNRKQGPAVDALVMRRKLAI